MNNLDRTAQEGGGQQLRKASKMNLQQMLRRRYQQSRGTPSSNEHPSPIQEPVSFRPPAQKEVKQINTAPSGGAERGEPCGRTPPGGAERGEPCGRTPPGGPESGGACGRTPPGGAERDGACGSQDANGNFVFDNNFESPSHNEVVSPKPAKGHRQRQMKSKGDGQVKARKTGQGQFDDALSTVIGEISCERNTGTRSKEPGAIEDGLIFENNFDDVDQPEDDAASHQQRGRNAPQTPQQLPNRRNSGQGRDSVQRGRNTSSAHEPSPNGRNSQRAWYPVQSGRNDQNALIQLPNGRNSQQAWDPVQSGRNDLQAHSMGRDPDQLAYEREQRLQRLRQPRQLPADHEDPLARLSSMVSKQNDMMSENKDNEGDEKMDGNRSVRFTAPRGRARGSMDDHISQLLLKSLNGSDSGDKNRKEDGHLGNELNDLMQSMMSQGRGEENKDEDHMSGSSGGGEDVLSQLKKTYGGMRGGARKGAGPNSANFMEGLGGQGEGGADPFAQFMGGHGEAMGKGGWNGGGDPISQMFKGIPALERGQGGEEEMAESQGRNGPGSLLQMLEEGGGGRGSRGGELAQSMSQMLGGGGRGGGVAHTQLSQMMGGRGDRRGGRQGSRQGGRQEDSRQDEGSADPMSQIMASFGGGQGGGQGSQVSTGGQFEDKEIDVENASSDDKIQQLLGYENLKAQNNKSPISDGMCTVIIIDTSGSMQGDSIVEAGQFIAQFLNGLEEVQFEYGLEENVAIVCSGREVHVLQHLTTDYSEVRRSVDTIYADGPSPLHMALMLPLSVLVLDQQQGRDYISNMNGHLIRPRVIVISDGHPTNEEDIPGQSTVVNQQDALAIQTVCGEMLQTVRERTLAEVYCVPVGNANIEFLEHLSGSVGGCMMQTSDAKQMSRAYLHHFVVGNLRSSSHISPNRATVLAFLQQTLACSDEEDVAAVMRILSQREPDVEARNRAIAQQQGGERNGGRGGVRGGRNRGQFPMSGGSHEGQANMAAMMQSMMGGGGQDGGANMAALMQSMMGGGGQGGGANMAALMQSMMGGGGQEGGANMAAMMQSMMGGGGQGGGANMAAMMQSMMGGGGQGGGANMAALMQSMMGGGGQGGGANMAAMMQSMMGGGGQGGGDNMADMRQSIMGGGGQGGGDNMAALMQSMMGGGGQGGGDNMADMRQSMMGGGGQGGGDNMADMRQSMMGGGGQEGGANMAAMLQSMMGGSGLGGGADTAATMQNLTNIFGGGPLGIEEGGIEGDSHHQAMIEGGNGARMGMPANAPPPILGRGGSNMAATMQPMISGRGSRGASRNNIAGQRDEEVNNADKTISDNNEDLFNLLPGGGDRGLRSNGNPAMTSRIMNTFMDGKNTNTTGTFWNQFAGCLPQNTAEGERRNRIESVMSADRMGLDDSDKESKEEDLSDDGVGQIKHDAAEADIFKDIAKHSNRDSSEQYGHGTQLRRNRKQVQPSPANNVFDKGGQRVKGKKMERKRQQEQPKRVTLDSSRGGYQRGVLGNNCNEGGYPLSESPPQHNTPHQSAAMNATRNETALNVRGRRGDQTRKNERESTRRQTNNTSPEAVNTGLECFGLIDVDDDDDDDEEVEGAEGFNHSSVKSAFVKHEINDTKRSSVDARHTEHASTSARRSQRQAQNRALKEKLQQRQKRRQTYQQRPTTYDSEDSDTTEG